MTDKKTITIDQEADELRWSLEKEREHNKPNEKINNQKFMTVHEVAQELRLTDKGVQRLCREKILGASKPGKSFLIPRESLDDYLSIIR